MFVNTLNVFFFIISLPPSVELWCNPQYLCGGAHGVGWGRTEPPSRGTSGRPPLSGGVTPPFKRINNWAHFLRVIPAFNIRAFFAPYYETTRSHYRVGAFFHDNTSTFPTKWFTLHNSLHFVHSRVTGSYRKNSFTVCCTIGA
jgi:hypothetical protein